MGRGRERPALRLDLTEGVSVVIAAASVDEAEDVGDSERLAGEMGGVLLLVVGDISSAWRNASRTSDDTWGSRGTSSKLHTVDYIDFPPVQ